MSEPDRLESPGEPSPSAPSEFPLAKTRERSSSRKRLSTRLWWLTAVCAATALVLVGSGFLQRETKITIRFREGHGIKPGDSLRYRGIDVGEVTDVHLSDQLDHLQIVISLAFTYYFIEYDYI